MKTHGSKVLINIQPENFVLQINELIYFYIVSESILYVNLYTNGKFLENLFKKVLKFYGVQDRMETRTRVIDNLKLLEVESVYTCFLRK